MELARPTVGVQREEAALHVAEDSRPVVAPELGSSDDVTCNHLWMREGHFIVYGTVLTGAEATELPWRRRKDHELASPNEIRRDLELVQSLYVRGQNQGPEAFDEVKLYLREDIG